MNDGITTTMPVAPVTQTNEGMMGGMSWIWIILIIFLLGGNNGGLFGGGNNGALANQVNNDFLYTQSKIDGIRQDLVGQTNQLNQSLNAGINSVNMGICNLGHQIDSGFCNTNRNIDQVRFENAQNTCTITTAIGASTQAIKDLINSNTMQDLRDRNVALEGALSNVNQTAAIVNQLRPYPTAAYLTVNPQVPCGYSYGGGVPFGNNACCPVNQCC